jgi:hypothetical protein
VNVCIVCARTSLVIEVSAWAHKARRLQGSRRPRTRPARLPRAFFFRFAATGQHVCRRTLVTFSSSFPRSVDRPVCPGKKAEPEEQLSERQRVGLAASDQHIGNSTVADLLCGFLGRVTASIGANRLVADSGSWHAWRKPGQLANRPTTELLSTGTVAGCRR